jgi:hypothetical protein
MSFLKDGHSTTVSIDVLYDELGSGVTVLFKEVELTPPSLDGGDKIKTTTMRNTKYHTYEPRTLVEVGPTTFTCTYDPGVYDQILTIINMKGLVTVTFPDSSTIVVWAYLRSFTPSNCVEGEEPTATCVIETCNTNDSDAETAPDYVAAA